MPYHSCSFKTKSPQGKTSSTLILTKTARSLFTKRCGSTTRHTTCRGVRMLSTSEHDQISWLHPPKTIARTRTGMADSLISSQSQSTTKGQSKLLGDPSGKRSKFSGCAGLSRTLPTRMGFLVFASHGCGLLNRMIRQSNGTVLSHRLTCYVLPT